MAADIKTLMRISDIIMHAKDARKSALEHDYDAAAIHAGKAQTAAMNVKSDFSKQAKKENRG